jgi:Holliday junction resolvasome RuvABC DNA-binding subunit
MNNLKKYKQNLRIENNKVISYTTHVATINQEDQTLNQLGYWSQTTQKHINYVASEMNLELIK